MNLSGFFAASLGQNHIPFFATLLTLFHGAPYRDFFGLIRTFSNEMKANAEPTKKAL
jgi:hypothetical protein